MAVPGGPERRREVIISIVKIRKLRHDFNRTLLASATGGPYH
jgi:hypothetical protein